MDDGDRAAGSRQDPAADGAQQEAGEATASAAADDEQRGSSGGLNQDAEALRQLERLAVGVAVNGALFEGRAADVESAHALPGDLLVVAASDVEQRPPLTYLRCPVAIVPARRATPTSSVGVERSPAGAER